jgi:hypothetical protein
MPRAFACARRLFRTARSESSSASRSAVDEPAAEIRVEVTASGWLDDATDWGTVGAYCEATATEPPPPPPPLETAVTVTVTMAVVELPEPFVAVKVYVVVCDGLTEVDVSLVTFPMPLLSVVVEAFDTVQKRTDDSPGVIDEGLAEKELMTGRPALPEHDVPAGVMV